MTTEATDIATATQTPFSLPEALRPFVTEKSLYMITEQLGVDPSLMDNLHKIAQVISKGVPSLVSERIDDVKQPDLSLVQANAFLRFVCFGSVFCEYYAMALNNRYITLYQFVGQDKVGERIIPLSALGEDEMFLDIKWAPAGAITQEQVIALPDFIAQFKQGLLGRLAQQNPAVFDENTPTPKAWDTILDGLLRKPLAGQVASIKAVSTLLVQKSNPAAIINGEMGTGKTFMGAACASILHHEGYQRTLVLSPPHLVYKWRREILQTVPNAKVWILNGADTLKKLLFLRTIQTKPQNPEFFILGRVRMRMGYSWQPAYMVRSAVQEQQRYHWIACPDCGHVLQDAEGNPLQTTMAEDALGDQKQKCPQCNAALWSLVRGKSNDRSRTALVLEALEQIPSIGKVRAQTLLAQFGQEMLAGMLEDNFHNFVHLMNEDGEFIFSDRQAKRIDRFFGSAEISFGQGGFQPTEFIKRYFAKGWFGCMLVDEGHEYKNEGSAQGQAFGVLASQVKKTILLTGTLMGGYADDLFYLLYRMAPQRMIADGFGYNQRGSLGPGAQAFMRTHGVLIDVYKEAHKGSFKTSKGTQMIRHTKKGPGFGPKGVMRYVLPVTSFVRLCDVGASLPPYQEQYTDIPLDERQAPCYEHAVRTLSAELKDSLRKGNRSLMGVVLNALLAWPDCAFRAESVLHPHGRKLLWSAPSLYDDTELMPKEIVLLRICKQELAESRKVLVYSTYTGARDTTARLRRILEHNGIKTAILKSSVQAAKREDWVCEQLDKGVQVVITNPELVKTGLDLLEFPTIVFMQTGYNVYTLQQASRRSWRIGQQQDVRVIYLGYTDTAQQQCLKLMAKKIAVAQSTSGDMPETGLDILNQDGDSIEMALARQLVG